jgi:uncharacterized protein
MPTTDPAVVAFVVAALAFGGFAKGITGLVLPAVAVSLLSLVLPITAVLPLIIVALVVTNAWQAVGSRRLGPTLRRFWPLVLVMLATTYLSARFLAEIDVRLVYLVVAVAVLLFVATGPLQERLVVPRRHERWLNPLVGAAAGVIGGPSGIYGPTVGLYLIALRLPREDFVSVIGLTMTLNSVMILVALADAGRFGTAELAWGSLALVPVALGMAVGTRVRHRIDQERFRLILRVTLFLLALNLLRQALI